MPFILVSTPITYAILFFVVTFIVVFTLLLIRGYEMLINMPIFYKFVLSMIMVAVIPVIVLEVNTYKAVEQIVIQEKTSAINSVADLKSQLFSTFFEERVSDMQNIQNSNSLRLNHKGISADFDSKEYLASKANLDISYKKFIENEGLAELLIVDESQNIVYSTETIFKEESLGRKFEIMEDGSTYFSDSEIVFSELDIKEDNSFDMYMTGPVNFEDFSGHVVFILDLNKIKESLNVMTILGETGEIEILKEANFRERGSGIVKENDDRNVLAAWRYIPLVKWEVVTKVDLQEILSPVGVLMRNVAIVIGVFLVVIITFSWLLSQLILSRLSKLSDVLTDIDEGRVVNWSSVKSGGKDEIGKIINSFKKMFSNMSLAQAELQKRLNELHRFSQVTVGRELRMAELKKEIQILKESTEKKKKK